LTGGGKEYNYQQTNGESFSITVPPASFDSRTATAAELELYGIPTAPPLESPEYPKWKAMIDNGIQSVTPPPFLAEDTAAKLNPSSAPSASQKANVAPFDAATTGEAATDGLSGSWSAGVAPSETATTGLSNNWSGYIDWNGQGKFTHATGYFVEPKTTSACEKPKVSGRSAAYIWAGIGGWGGNKDLGQDGTAMHENGLGEDEAWYEILPAEKEPIALGIKATPGKFFTDDTNYANGEYKFYVYDFGSKKHMYGHGKGPIDANVNDFIVERAGKNNLLDVGNVESQGFTNGAAFATNKTERVEMINGEGTVNAAPGGITNKYSYSDQYKNCNGLGEGAGEEGAPEEGALPVVTVATATGVSESAATVHGTVNPEGFATTYHFEYGTQAEDFEASSTPANAGAGTQAVQASATVAGLRPGTTYHYRVIADSATGTEASGELTFTTAGSPPPPAPTVVTGGSSALKARSATLEGSVNPNGLEAHYYFQYGTGPGLYESSAPAEPGDTATGTSPEKVAIGLTGLTAYTKYYYRIVASSSSGTSYGEEMQFTTPNAWTIMKTANPKTTLEVDVLYGVACPATNVCTAVGSFFGVEEHEATLAETLSGTAWEAVATPNPTGSTGSFLQSVSCPGSSECMATGYFEPSGGGGTHSTLAEQRSGSTWTVVTTPTKANSASLASVSCFAAKECLTVGSYVSGTPAKSNVLVELWNGKTWKEETPAKLPTGDEGAQFSGVSCPAAKVCQAVGTYYSATEGTQPLIESWNGTKLTLGAPAEPKGVLEVKLNGVSCSSSTACTAVGEYNNFEAHNFEALVERWNGTTWTLQETPSPIAESEPEGGARWHLDYVACPTATSCVGVGAYKESASGPNVLLGEHWNGTAWELELPENRPGAKYNTLKGVACATEAMCVTVGDTEHTNGSDETLAEIEEF